MSGGVRVWMPGARQDGGGPAGAVSADDRRRILSVAAQITAGRHDPAAVLESAGPMLAWAGEAATRGDRSLRIEALHQQSLNEGYAGSRSMGNPCGFTAKATVLYAFMVTGNPSGGDGDSCLPGRGVAVKDGAP